MKSLGIIKKTALIALAVLSMLAFLFGIMPLTKNSVVAIATTDNLYMSSGASVRTEDPMGIGFITNVKKSYYDGLISEGKTVTTGTIFLRKAEVELANVTIDNDTFTIENKDVLKSSNITIGKLENKGWLTTGTDYYSFRGSIIGLQEADSQREFMARGYICVDGTDYEYTDFIEADHTRSLEQVSLNAFNTGASLNANQKTFLQTFICDTALTDGVQESNAKYLTMEKAEIGTKGVYRSSSELSAISGTYSGNAVEFDAAHDSAFRVNVPASDWIDYDGSKYLSMWVALSPKTSGDAISEYVAIAGNKGMIFQKESYVSSSNPDDTANNVVWGSTYDLNVWYNIVAPIKVEHFNSDKSALDLFVLTIPAADRDKFNIYIGNVEIVDFDTTKYLWKPSDYQTNNSIIETSFTSIGHLTSDNVAQLNFANNAGYNGEALGFARDTAGKTNYIRIKYAESTLKSYTDSGCTKIKVWVAVTSGKWAKTATPPYLINEESTNGTSSNVSAENLSTWVCYEYDITTVTTSYVTDGGATDVLYLLSIANTGSDTMLYLGNIEIC